MRASTNPSARWRVPPLGGRPSRLATGRSSHLFLPTHSNTRQIVPPQCRRKRVEANQKYFRSFTSYPQIVSNYLWAILSVSSKFGAKKGSVFWKVVCLSYNMKKILNKIIFFSWFWDFFLILCVFSNKLVHDMFRLFSTFSRGYHLIEIYVKFIISKVSRISSCVNSVPVPV